MGPIYAGKSERLLYSLSRWTDLPAAKWPWFKGRLEAGFMLGVDPRTAVPSLWSLKPQDVLGLVFWTKNPTNLIEDAAILDGFPLVVHVTLTGWTEVEHGAPNIKWGLKRIQELVQVFGPEKVIWRFSPVPAVPDVLDRFKTIARDIENMGLSQVYVSFLQTNDLMPELRSLKVQQDLLRQMAGLTSLRVLVCNENRVLEGLEQKAPNLCYGVCEDGCRFTGGDPLRRLPLEGCGCALAVDPFTITEACSMGCAYCYAADRTLAVERRDTTRKLQVVT